MYNEFFDNIEELKKNKVIAVAVSGGIDSLSLTLLANEWGKKNNVKIIGVTVDHRLRESSKNEAEYINKLLNKFEIEHYILNWEGEKPKNNIENIAREARYKLIFDFCKQQEINTILLGHHIQDQAENFLIRLFRGSGIEGLSSMKQVSYRDGFCIVRPFLNLKKEDLEEYLKSNKIEWIEDESNSDERYLRNKIRKFLNSFDNKDDIIKRVNSTVEVFQTAEKIIENNINELEGSIYFLNKNYNYFTLNFKKFFQIEKELQLRILSKISKQIGEHENNPRFAKLERLLESLKNLKRYTFYGCIFEKINCDDFVCYKEYNSIKDKTNYLEKGELNQYLKFLKENNFLKYKEIKDFKGYKKEILYTIPIYDFKR